MRISKTLIVGLSASTLFACTPVAVGGPSPVVPGAEPSTRIPRPTHTGVGESNTMRYVCRGKVDSGWIAIDYIDDAESCPTSRARYGVAVIVPLRNSTVGASLEVCADERIPRGWQEVQMLAADGRCPDTKPTSDATRRTVREIRRVQ